MTKNNPQQPSEATDIQIAKLAYIGASISTLGDGLSAVAAGLALNALEKSNNQNPQVQNNDQSKEVDDLQKQIDYLINELKQVKKIDEITKFSSKLLLKMILKHKQKGGQPLQYNVQPTLNNRLTRP